MLARRLVKHVRNLAALTGESIAEAVRTAIEQRLRRESARRRAGTDIQPAGARP